MQSSLKSANTIKFSAGVILMAAPAIVFYALLWKTAFPYPLADDYDVFLRFVNTVSQLGSFSSRLLCAITAEHNGYKLMLDNFVALAQYTLCGHIVFLPLVALGDMFALLIFGVTCSMSQIARGNTPARFLLLAPTAFLVLQLQYASALNFASCSLQQLPVIFFSFLAILLLTKPSLTSFTGACLAIALAVASSPNGFFVVPVGIVLLIQMRQWRRLIPLVGCAAALVAIYAFRYQRTPTDSASYGSAGNFTHFNIVYAISFLGSSAARFTSIKPSLVLGLLLSVLFVVAAGRKYFAKNPAIFYCMAFIMINAVAVSGLRSDQGVVQSLASRYRIFSNLLLAFSYMYILEDLLPLVKSVALRRSFLVTAAAVSVAFCALSDVAGARFLEGKKEMVSAQFAAQWHAQASGAPVANSFANPALSRQLNAGIFDVDLPVLRESVRLNVFTPPGQP